MLVTFPATLRLKFTRDESLNNWTRVVLPLSTLDVLEGHNFRRRAGLDLGGIIDLKEISRSSLVINATLC